MTTPVTMLDVTTDYCVACWDRVFVVVWRQHTTPEGVAALHQHYNRLAATCRGPLALLTIVEENASLPSTDARLAVASLLAAAAGRVRFSALVHEGSGLRAAAVRGVVAGLTTMARMPYPHVVFGTTEAAARWLEESEAAAGSPTLRAHELIEAVAAMRSQLPASAPPTES